MNSYYFYNEKNIMYTLHFKLFKMKQNFSNSTAIYNSQ